MTLDQNNKKESEYNLDEDILRCFLLLTEDLTTG